MLYILNARVNVETVETGEGQRGRSGDLEEGGTRKMDNRTYTSLYTVVCRRSSGEYRVTGSPFD
jgi:hypothetical protein